MPLPAPPAHETLARHPRRADLSWILEEALAYSQSHADSNAWDQPFGMALTHIGELQPIVFLGKSTTRGQVEYVEAQLYSLRPVLRACARGTIVTVHADGAPTFTALRIQLEHADGPPLDAYHPLDPPGPGWIEPGSPTIFPRTGR